LQIVHCSPEIRKEVLREFEVLTHETPAKQVAQITDQFQKSLKEKIPDGVLPEVAKLQQQCFAASLAPTAGGRCIVPGSTAAPVGQALGSIFSHSANMASTGGFRSPLHLKSSSTPTCDDACQEGRSMKLTDAPDLFKTVQVVLAERLNAKQAVILICVQECGMCLRVPC
jgi:hypothetical protein